ncbi:DUF4240 domain-containing protein [Kribbella sp. NPDC051620]|uniref:DUF4240 domain-containing protein n=1 Tax=Kribbella sp. NPDC051620 TaxID=3364120 RepID=UPI0037A52EDB
MTEFWKIIGSSALTSGEEVEEAVAAVGRRLSGLAESELIQFDKELREHLFRIDKKELADIPVTLSSGQVLTQTDDYFLYARCACVLGGESRYAGAQVEVPEFAQFVVPYAQRAEELIYLAADVYEERTGLEFPSDVTFPIDTGSNKEGWLP